MGRVWLLLSMGLAAWSVAGSAVPVEVSASAPTETSVTLYRDPNRTSGPDSLELHLDGLGGFALVTETRTVSIPAGLSRLRFVGVADGIQPESAIIIGLPHGLLEKNHDAKVLSPSSLVTATVGRSVWLVRTDPKTGKTAQVEGKLVADGEGVVFQSSAGLEALRCSGLPETFRFEANADTAATPTLSAWVRSPAPVTAKVRLSYLARGFDWMATYTATVSDDGTTMDLGAWVTLANSNATSFPETHAQVVAGRLNRESGEVEPIDNPAEILADCWPRGSTSDAAEGPDTQPASPLDERRMVIVTGSRMQALAMAPEAKAGMAQVMVTQEQLGDLKLYRVPDRTSVNSRQIKQVRLLDRQAVHVELIYSAEIRPNVHSTSAALRKILRTRNDSVHRLGLPLPSGRVDTFYERDGTRLLVKEGSLRDVSINEEFELAAGDAPDVQVTSVLEHVHADLTSLKDLPLIPGVVHLHSNTVDDVNRLEISNARGTAVSVELCLQLPDGSQLIRADHAVTTHNGRPAFRLTVAAGDKVAIRYQTEHTAFRPRPG